MVAKKIIVTGTSGFIGGFLVQQLLDAGHFVYAFQRKKGQSDNERLQFIEYDFRGTLDDKCFKEASFLIHCAYVSLLKKNEPDVNYSAMKQLLEKCRFHEVKIIFLSSVSAQNHIDSRYAISKMAIEKLLNVKQDVILKLGLVIGNGGLFHNISTFIKRSKLVPVFDGGHQNIQFISIYDVGKSVRVLLNEFLPNAYVIVKNEPTGAINFYRAIASGLNKERRYVNFSLVLTNKFLRILEALRIPFPITTENLMGLKQTRQLAQKLPNGITDDDLLDLSESLKRLRYD